MHSFGEKSTIPTKAFKKVIPILSLTLLSRSYSFKVTCWRLYRMLRNNCYNLINHLFPHTFTFGYSRIIWYQTSALFISFVIKPSHKSYTKIRVKDVLIQCIWSLDIILKQKTYQQLVIPPVFHRLLHRRRCQLVTQWTEGSFGHYFVNFIMRFVGRRDNLHGREMKMGISEDSPEIGWYTRWNGKCKWKTEWDWERRRTNC